MPRNIILFFVVFCRCLVIANRPHVQLVKGTGKNAFLLLGGIRCIVNPHDERLKSIFYFSKIEFVENEVILGADLMQEHDCIEVSEYDSDHFSSIIIFLL
jgi:hypothetical protein